MSYYAPGGFFVVQTPSAVPEWVSGLRGAPGVRYAEPNFILRAADVSPDDPLWSSQWGPQKVDAPAAWTATTGSADVVVGVIDSGVDYTHQDLASQMWTNPSETPGDGIDNDGDGYVDDVHGVDCRNNDGDPMDDFGHGTEVAGIIGAAGNNGTGISGMSWHVSIMALKFLGPTGSGTVADAVKCIDYATAHGVPITNNSWGGTIYSQALFDAVDRARAAGQLFVAAAGNLGANIDDTPFYPAAFSLDNVISVASTDATDVLATDSDYGPVSVDIGAPGQEIVTTWPGNTYFTDSGTSMAAPHVAGAAALVLSVRPQDPYPQLISTLYSTVDVLDSLTGKVSTGGRLNAGSAIASVVPPSPPVGLAAIPGIGQVALDWSDDLETDLASYRVYRTLDPPGGLDRTWAEVGTTTTSDFTDTGLSNGTTYYYRVTAVDVFGNESAPSDEVAATTILVASFAPSQVKISKGTAAGDPLSNLASSDDAYFRVSASLVGKKYLVDWTGTSTVQAAGASSLTFSYEGSWTDSVSQRILVKNVRTGAWEVIASGPVSTADAGVSWSTLDPASYVSGRGQVSMRITIDKSPIPVTCRADLMSFTLEY
jgi:subtilisin family serine protease